ncbi:MAG: aminoglycoside phosphotransferase family protein [Fimbriimonadaceae bacterium]
MKPSSQSDLRKELEARWQTGPLEPIASGYCSHVYGNEDLILKIPFQGEEMTSGWRAALLFSGNIGPKVFRFDPDTGSLLMERIHPGTNLSGETEEVALSVILGFAEKIRGIRCAFELLNDYSAVTGGRTTPRPSSVVSYSRPRGILPLDSYFENPSARTRELLDSQTERALLHGDLHHENVILGPSGWVVIDAKGLWGDPAFEAAAFVRNPIDWIGDIPNITDYVESRIKRIADRTGWDSRRIWGWSLVALGENENQSYPWDRVRAALLRLETAFAF